MFFWASAAQTAAKLESLRHAETKLLQIAKTYGGSRSLDPYELKTFDTEIDGCVVPLRGGKCGSEAEKLVIHAVQVVSNKSVDRLNSTEVPLVMLHGYMNAGAYFYRNFGGLSQYFQSIYALDMLGWGLSSRPSFAQIVDRTSAKTAEDFFVESLEAWRAENKIDRMVLAGHSMGGYMSVAYCERYPERVERLLLLSPVGVPDEKDPSVQERIEYYQSSWRSRTFLGVFRTIFEMTTVGTILRTVPEKQSYEMAHSYVQRRLPEISDPVESSTVADYLYYNSILPGSGEFFIHNVLTSRVLAKKPLISRIPNLKVKNVTFMYGTTDWMDLSGGLNTQRLCETLRADGLEAPEVDVHLIPSAGHLLMLQNWQATNASMIYAAGGKVNTEDLPTVLEPGTEELPKAWLHETLNGRRNSMEPDRTRGALSADMSNL
jgi:cardiolipin-specific phospholipase